MVNTLKIFFHPDPVIPEIETSVREYQNIWSESGDAILEAIHKISGLEIKETEIHAIVRESMSQAYPLTLRASYKSNTKYATIIHELLHRLFNDSGIFVLKNAPKDGGLLSHKVVNLVLYDIWIELKGKDFADEEMRVESSRTEIYEHAWSWALAMTIEERKAIFTKLKNGVKAEDLIK